MVRHGWAIVWRRGDETGLRRPGKERGGHSAVWHKDWRLLVVFSTSTPLETERGYSGWSLYGLLECGGDFKAAARQFAFEGYGEAPQRRRPSRGPIPVAKPDVPATPASSALALAPAPASTAPPRQTQPYLLNSCGALRPILANATTMPAEPDWCGVLAFDDFGERVAARKPPPWGSETPVQWGDQEVRKTAEWMQRNQLFVTTEVVGQACQTVARENPFHPVRGYLASLVWDGVPRLVFWAERYLGAPGDPYTQAVSKCWILSGVARVYEPGCKADHVLILEGLQGSGRSIRPHLMGQKRQPPVSSLGEEAAGAVARRRRLEGWRIGCGPSRPIGGTLSERAVGRSSQGVTLLTALPCTAGE